MVISILIALVVTVVVLFLAGLVVEKLSPEPIPSRLTWAVWLIAVIVVVFVWWVRVLAPLVGPLP